MYTCLLSGFDIGFYLIYMGYWNYRSSVWKCMQSTYLYCYGVPVVLLVFVRSFFLVWVWDNGFLVVVVVVVVFFAWIWRCWVYFTFTSLRYLIFLGRDCKSACFCFLSFLWNGGLIIGVGDTRLRYMEEIRGRKGGGAVESWLNRRNIPVLLLSLTTSSRICVCLWYTEDVEMTEWKVEDGQIKSLGHSCLLMRRTFAFVIFEDSRRHHMGDQVMSRYMSGVRRWDFRDYVQVALAPMGVWWERVCWDGWSCLEVWKRYRRCLVEMAVQ